MQIRNINMQPSFTYMKGLMTHSYHALQCFKKTNALVPPPHTHTYIYFTDPISVNRQLNMKHVNINFRQNIHTQETMDTTKTYYTKINNTT
jgi:hypothetical protein